MSDKHLPTDKCLIGEHHHRFVELLPTIQSNVQYAFRRLRGEEQDDAVAEAIANCFVAYARLVTAGKVKLAYPSALARFAVAQHRAGRRVGARQNSKDVLWLSSHNRSRVRVERFRGSEARESNWFELVVEDSATPVADQAAFRCDFPAWLATLGRRTRQIAEALYLGDFTAEVARRFRISAGRVSQLRRELHASWHAFHCEKPRVAA